MEKGYNRSTYCLQDNSGMGTVHISDDVVAVIACLAAAEVKGVYAVAGNPTNELLSRAGRKLLSKGVKVIIHADKVKIGLAVMMEYGYNIPGTCAKLQDRVKASVESMTGMKVTDVDIRISGVNMQKR